MLEENIFLISVKSYIWWKQLLKWYWIICLVLVNLITRTLRTIYASTTTYKRELLSGKLNVHYCLKLPKNKKDNHITCTLSLLNFYNVLWSLLRNKIYSKRKWEKILVYERSYKIYLEFQGHNIVSYPMYSESFAFS